MIVFADKLQYYLSFDDGTTWIRVSENSEFEPSTDMENYEPVYKDRLNQPSFVVGKKTNIEFVIDVYDDKDLQSKLLEHEHDINVPVQLVRVEEWNSAADGGFKAIKGDFGMTQNLLDGPAGEAVQISGSMSMTSDGWVEGSFDKETEEFSETPSA